MQKITTLAQLIAQVESSGNLFAVRFEPSHNPSMNQVSKMHVMANISMSTAHTLCMMSFGLFQIMGDNLMKLGLSVSPLAYCTDGSMQYDFFKRYCIINQCEYTLEDVINDEEKRLDFAKKYNGPGNVQDYAARMMQVYSENK